MVGHVRHLLEQFHHDWLCTVHMALGEGDGVTSLGLGRPQGDKERGGVGLRLAE